MLTFQLTFQRSRCNVCHQTGHTAYEYPGTAHESWCLSSNCLVPRPACVCLYCTDYIYSGCIQQPDWLMMQASPPASQRSSDIQRCAVLAAGRPQDSAPISGPLGSQDGLQSSAGEGAWVRTCCMLEPHMTRPLADTTPWPDLKQPLLFCGIGDDARSACRLVQLNINVARLLNLLLTAFKRRKTN